MGPVPRVTTKPETVDAIDAQLIGRICMGSEEALAEMYDRHAGPIFATALRLLGDRSDAQEVVQETFLALWNRAEQFDTERGSAKTWLMSIARNRAVDRARANLSRVRASTFSSVLDGNDEDGEADDWLLTAAQPIAIGAPRSP